MSDSIQEQRRLKLVELLSNYKDKGVTVAALARKYGIDTSHISQLKNKNRGFGEDAARNLEIALNLPKFYFEPSYQDLGIDDILNNAPKPLVASDDNKRIPIDLYDVKVCCGNGSQTFGFEPVKRPLFFNESFFVKKRRKPSHCILVYAINDSMSPYICDGDVVMIDRSVVEPRDGEVYAVWFEGELMFKRIFKETGGVLRLSSDNKIYGDKVVTIDNGADFKILGEQFYRSG